jgi:hypothetical protein
LTNSHGDIDEMFCSESSDDTEENDHDDPTESFKVVNEFVSEECNDERYESDKDNADDKRTFSI